MYCQIGRMVVPSKNLLHPFRTAKPKLPEQSESSNPPTDKSANNKPVPKKKPFANLMTMAPVKPKTSETLKCPIQKGGDTMSGFEMEQPKTVSSKLRLSLATFSPFASSLMSGFYILHAG